MKMNVDPDSLIPKLPKPKDLQPFPMVEGLKFTEHKGEVKSISLSKTGQFLVSGCSKGEVKFWEVLTGKCYRSLQFEQEITKVSFFPSSNLASVAAVSSGDSVYFVNSGLGDVLSVKRADAYFRGLQFEDEEATKNDRYVWSKESENLLSGRRIRIKHPNFVNGFHFRPSGSHIVAMVAGGGKQQVVIHNVGEQKSIRWV